jgi:hypothetical protein
VGQRLRSLDALKAEYEAAEEALQAARERYGAGQQVAEVELRFQEAESRYHAALYESAPGMTNEDRTAAAQWLKDVHADSYAIQRERDARERVDDISRPFTVEVVEEYQAAVDERRGMGLPEPDDAWETDIRDEWAREKRSDMERDAFEEAKREGFDGYDRWQGYER